MLTAERPLNVPKETFESLRNYVDNHRAPGGFLTAVLSNDLMAAVFLANEECLEALTQIADFIFNNCPGNCWGSSEAVRMWISAPNRNRQALHLVPDQAEQWRSH